jgi:hypothetical protein
MYGLIEAEESACPSLLAKTVKCPFLTQSGLSADALAS